MRHPNTIALIERKRMLRPYLDFVIDQRFLAEHLVARGEMALDVVSPFGWPGEHGHELAKASAARLLRKAPPDLPGGRSALLVCPECADLGCGAVTAIIERQDDLIIWHSFGFETNNASGQLDLESFRHVREFAFRADLYSAVFRRYLR